MKFYHRYGEFSMKVRDPSNACYLIVSLLFRVSIWYFHGLDLLVPTGGFRLDVATI